MEWYLSASSKQYKWDTVDDKQLWSNLYTEALKKRSEEV